MSKKYTAYTSTIGATIENLLKANAWKATKFISEKYIVRATRQLERKKLSNVGNLEITLTIGHPNYEERDYVRMCKKAHMHFPLKNVWLKFPPKPQPKKKGKNKKK